MNVDPSHVYMGLCVRMLWGLTSVTMHMDSLDTNLNLTLIKLSVSLVSMKVCEWIEEVITTVIA